MKTAHVGPETGRWRIEDNALVLINPRGENSETVRRLPIDGLARDSVTLAGERWDRVR